MRLMKLEFEGNESSEELATVIWRVKRTKLKNFLFLSSKSMTVVDKKTALKLLKALQQNPGLVSEVV
jgi:hypothetical protein